REDKKSYDLDKLELLGVPHPRRPKVSSLAETTEQYELFWSLNFAIRRKSFEKIGGFDTQYQGYGAEDTDFAFMARQRSVPFALSRARCYHQHHAVYRPPLQHFADIMTNAHRFHEKWGNWPMESWLDAFENMNLINWNGQETHLEIIREPTLEEIESAYYPAPAGF
ncbi:MAG: galactosyltransferase-related protein, partial [Bacteroidota bacterium]